MRIGKKGLIALVGLLLFGSLVGCQKKETMQQVAGTSVKESEKTKDTEIKEEVIRGEDWLYFREDYEGPLMRMQLSTQKEEQVVKGISQWLAAENQLLYSTNEDWDSLYTSSKSIVVINELSIASLDGSKVLKLVGKENEFDFKTEFDANQYYLRYNPLGIADDWVYFNVILGIPETDASQNTIYRIRPNGKELEAVCEAGHAYVYDFYVVDDAIYYASSYMGDYYMGNNYSMINQVDLETKQANCLTNEGFLLGAYEDALYYAEIVTKGAERSCKVNKVVSGKRGQSIKEEVAFENEGDQILLQLQDHKIYIGKPFDEYGSVSYSKAYDLTTKEVTPSLPYEQSYYGGSASRQALSASNNQIYYLDYADQWHWTNELKVLDVATKTTTTLKMDLIETQLLHLYPKTNKQMKLKTNVATAEANLNLQAQLHEETGVFYSTETGLYRIDEEGKKSTKIYDLDSTSTWRAVEVNGEKVLCFNVASNLYKGNLQGTSLEILAENTANTWRYFQDDQTGEGWFLCEDDNQNVQVVSLDGKVSFALPHKNIGNVEAYKGKIIYSLQTYPYGEADGNPVEPVIYSCDIKGEAKAFIDFNEFYTATEEVWDELGKVYSSLEAIREDQLYFTVADWSRNVVELFEYDLKTDEVKSVYKVQPGLEPYLEVNIDDKFIYLSYAEVRHSYVNLQLDRKDFTEIDAGYKIGEDASYIYKLKYDGIYSLDKGTKKSHLLTQVFPMFWYDDYKEISARQLGDWIYFNDYAVYPTDSEYNNRAEMPDVMFRVNVKTKQRQQMEDDLRYINYYVSDTREMDDEGYFYFAYTKEGDNQIIKLKDSLEVIKVIETSSYIKQLEYLK